MQCDGAMCDCGIRHSSQAMHTRASTFLRQGKHVCRVNERVLESVVVRVFILLLLSSVSVIATGLFNR